MSPDLIPGLEYETMIFGRHVLTTASQIAQESSSLDYSAYILLSLLEVTGPVSIREICEITGKDASTLNRQTAVLLRKEYAERIPDPSGGVARKFRNSRYGTQILSEARLAVKEKLAEISVDWERQDLERLTELLGRLNRDIEKHAGQPWPRPPQ